MDKLKLVMITCEPTKKIFLKTTTSKNDRFDHLASCIEQNRLNNYYEPLIQSIREHGKSTHKVSVIATGMMPRELQADIYKKVAKLQDEGMSLNDINISPTRETCPACGDKIREEFIARHQQQYCRVLTHKKNLEKYLALGS